MKSRYAALLFIVLIAAILCSGCQLFLDYATVTTQNYSYRTATVTIDGVTKTVSGYGSKEWTVYFDFGDSSKFITCHATFSGLTGSLTQYYTIYPYIDYTWNINSSKGLE